MKQKFISILISVPTIVYRLTLCGAKLRFVLIVNRVRVCLCVRTLMRAKFFDLIIKKILNSCLRGHWKDLE